MKEWLTSYWDYAAERALKTLAQTMLAMLSAAGAERTIGVHFGILTIDWITILSVSSLAAIMSLLTSVVALTSKETK